MRIKVGAFGPHFLALSLALVMWFFVMYTQSPQAIVQPHTLRLNALTLEVRNRPSGLTLVHELAPTVNMTLRGSEQALAGFRGEDAVPFIDLHGLREGTHQLAVRATLPSGVELISSWPARIEVVLEEIISSSVPVSVSLEGSLPAGLFVPPGEVVPSSIIVTGGKGVVARVAPFVIRVDAAGLTSTRTATAELVARDVAGQAIDGITLSTSNVEYRLEVYPTKTVPIRLEPQGQPATGVGQFRLEFIAADGATVTGQAVLAGPAALLGTLTELVATVDVTGRLDGATIDVALVPPSGSHLVAPASIRVRLQAGQP